MLFPELLLLGRRAMLGMGTAHAKVGGCHLLPAMSSLTGEIGQLLHFRSFDIKRLLAQKGAMGGLERMGVRGTEVWGEGASGRLKVFEKRLGGRIGEGRSEAEKNERSGLGSFGWSPAGLPRHSRLRLTLRWLAVQLFPNGWNESSIFISLGSPRCIQFSIHRYKCIQHIENP